MATHELSGGAAAIDRLSKELRLRAERALVSAAERGRGVIVNQIIPGRTPSPVDRGVYRAGWRAGPIKGGAEIWNGEVHAAFVERGVRAGSVKIGRAMIQALAEWAVRKGLVRGKKGGRGRLYVRERIGAGSHRVMNPEAIAVAWAIAKAMKRKGIFGQTGLRVLEELMTAHMPKIVGEEFRREVGR